MFKCVESKSKEQLLLLLLLCLFFLILFSFALGRWFVCNNFFEKSRCVYVYAFIFMSMSHVYVRQLGCALNVFLAYCLFDYFINSYGVNFNTWSILRIWWAYKDWTKKKKIENIFQLQILLVLHCMRLLLVYFWWVAFNSIKLQI